MMTSSISRIYCPSLQRCSHTGMIYVCAFIGLSIRVQEENLFFSSLGGMLATTKNYLQRWPLKGPSLEIKKDQKSFLNRSLSLQ
jgi:hypothetical protein